MFQGKNKAVTFSFDDGVTQDKRLIRLLDKYGLKGTFHLNSGCFGTARAMDLDGVTVPYVRFRAHEIRSLYAGHEIAAHTLTHPMLIHLPDEEVVREVEEDRLRLSELAGYEVVGLAYPGGSSATDSRVEALVRNRTGIRYARNTSFTLSFAPQEDLFRYAPTVYDAWYPDEMFRLAEDFLSMDAEMPQVFCLFGHAYELDLADNWERLEDFCRLISGHGDVFYGTCKQILLRME